MTSAEEERGAGARSQVYAFLAQGFAEPDATTLAGMRQTLPRAEAALAELGDAECHAALAALSREIGLLGPDELIAAHRRVFGLGVSGDCPPYEAEYGQPHIFQKAHCLADHAGFLKAFGLEPAPGFSDRSDHVSIELEFLHVLAAKEDYALAQGHSGEQVAIVRDATRSYLSDHLGRWAPAFAARVSAKAQEGPYAALARLLAVFLAQETRALGLAPVLADLVAPEPQADDGPPACGTCAAAAFNPAVRGVP